MNREGIKRLLRIIGISLIFIIVLGYTYLKTRDFSRGPLITIHSPENGSLFSTSTVITQGEAQRIKDLTMNGRPLTIDALGVFEETLVLLPGYNAIHFEAQDKFKRSTTYTLELIYQK